MAIEETILSGNQMDLLRWSCTTEANVITIVPPPEERDFCLCLYECSYTELAFYDILENSDGYKNDYRKFLVNPRTATSTYEFVLVTPNNGEVVIDDTLADVYAQGFNKQQLLQAGIKLIWWKVANLYGAGVYSVKTNQTDFGNTVTFESHDLNVVPFDTVRANQTVKVEVINKGVTMNGDDWSGFEEFTNMIRLGGKMSYSGEEVEVDSLVDSNRETVNVQKTSRSLYTLNIDDVPYDLAKPLLSNGILMDWLVTDYNVDNFGDLRKVFVTIEDSPSWEEIKQYSKRFPQIGLKEIELKVNRKFV